MVVLEVRSYLLPGAVHEVLLTERDQLAGSLEVSPLHGASGTERPAAATVSLVLHLRDVTLLSPVHSLVEFFQLGLRHHHLSVRGVSAAHHQTIHPLLDLVGSEVGQLVLPEVVVVLSILVLGVVVRYHLDCGGPD